MKAFKSWAFKILMPLNSENLKALKALKSLKFPSIYILKIFIFLCLTYKENIDVVLRYRSADQGRPWCP